MNIKHLLLLAAFAGATMAVTQDVKAYTAEYREAIMADYIAGLISYRELPDSFRDDAIRLIHEGIKMQETADQKLPAGAAVTLREKQYIANGNAPYQFLKRNYVSAKSVITTQTDKPKRPSTMPNFDRMVQRRGTVDRVAARLADRDRGIVIMKGRGNMNTMNNMKTMTVIEPVNNTMAITSNDMMKEQLPVSEAEFQAIMQAAIMSATAQVAEAQAAQAAEQMAEEAMTQAVEVIEVISSDDLDQELTELEELIMDIE